MHVASENLSPPGESSTVGRPPATSLAELEHAALRLFATARVRRDDGRADRGRRRHRAAHVLPVLPVQERRRLGRLRRTPGPPAGPPRGCGPDDADRRGVAPVHPRIQPVPGVRAPLAPPANDAPAEGARPPGPLHPALPGVARGGRGLRGAAGAARTPMRWSLRWSPTRHSAPRSPPTSNGWPTSKRPSPRSWTRRSGSGSTASGWIRASSATIAPWGATPPSARRGRPRFSTSGWPRPLGVGYGAAVGTMVGGGAPGSVPDGTQDGTTREGGRPNGHGALPVRRPAGPGRRRRHGNGGGNG